jgi:hypothetical protein
LPNLRQTAFLLGRFLLTTQPAEWYASRER